MTPAPDELETMSQVTASGMTPSQRRAGAELIFSAFPQFYRLFPAPKPMIVEAISDQIGVKGTELEECHAIMRGSDVVALLAVVPAERFAAGKKAGLVRILRRLQRSEMQSAMKALAGFETRMDPAPETGLYLARLGAAAGATGAGTRLLRRFLAQQPANLFSLHVHRSNPAAWMYAKLGFRFSCAEEREFRCMMIEEGAPPAQQPGER